MPLAQPSPSSRPSPSEDLLVLLARRDSLVRQAEQAEDGDIETLEVFDCLLRGNPKMVRREVRKRMNRTAAVMYWREVRATEDKIAELKKLSFDMEPVDVNIRFDPCAPDPPDTGGFPPEGPSLPRKNKP